MNRSAAELDFPESAWNRAAARTVQGDPFCCRTEWQLALQQAYFPKRQLHLRASASGLLALAERRYPELGRTLEPLDSLWFFGSPLLGPGAADLLEAFLAERTANGEPTTLLLGGVLPGSTLRERLLRGASARFDVYRVKTVTLCQASLEGGLDGYLSRRSGLLRKRLRQAARRAAARGIRYERFAPRTEKESDAVFARMLAVERASWKGRDGGGITDTRSSRFYAAMGRRLSASAGGRVILAREGERDVGFIFGGLAGGVYRGQQFSYAETASELSLGNLLQQEQIRWLVEDGVARYDMGPLMEYKQHWAETRVGMEVLLLQPKTRRRSG